MKKFIFAFGALLVAALLPLAADARDWTNLNVKPLQNPFNPNVIKAVIQKFSVLPRDVADELVALVIAGRGRPGTVCKGDQLAGMSFGHSEVWDEPTTVVWTNVRERCKSATFFETSRGGITYGVVRVHACRNLGPTVPRRGLAAPAAPSGPIFGLAPPADCPPRGGVVACC